MGALQPLRLGRYPTPVRRCESLDTHGGELWIKDDGGTASPYGGHKVRKLEYPLAAARARGARRIVTVGAGGSHHVLATTLYARASGMATAAVLWPQPWSSHAEATLRAALGAGLARESPARVVLYWHTLSTRPLEPLLADAPSTLPPALAPLLPGPGG